MEKRSNTRVTFGVGAVIKYKRQTIKCKVINLSLNGVLVKAMKEIPKDAKVRVGISMEGSTSKLKINIEGIVARSSAAETAIIFNSIDLDSFIHLKNIVAYNEGNEEKIMREFYKKVGTGG
ncbi:MAG: PilZ domain-containing protein [Spirochaetes bacterium]|nr:PilZ domain-containing protein [Spirochaetota bacterium]